jgi:hypothetical protein
VKWKLDLRAAPRGRLTYLRRTDGHGRVDVLGQRWRVSETWSHRLVRAEVDLNGNKIRFYTLRRREPKSQPWLLKVPYRLPQRTFQE